MLPETDHPASTTDFPMVEPDDLRSWARTGSGGQSAVPCGSSQYPSFPSDPTLGLSALFDWTGQIGLLAIIAGSYAGRDPGCAAGKDGEGYGPQHGDDGE